MIQEISHVASMAQQTFINEVYMEIEKYQKLGFTVEVQYQMNGGVYSAVVIGRSKR